MDGCLFRGCGLQRRHERRQDGGRNFFRQFVPTDSHCNGIRNYHQQSGWNYLSWNMFSPIRHEYKRYADRDSRRGLRFWWMEWSVHWHGWLHSGYDRRRIRHGNI